MNRFLLFLCLFLLCSNCKKDSNSTQTTNQVRVRLTAEPGRLHPILSVTSNAAQVSAHLFLPLLHFDPKTLELFPMVAKSRPIIEAYGEEGQSYTFEIREDVRWDDGSPVLAEDYVFNLKTLFNPAVDLGRSRSYFEFVEKVTIDPDNPRRFTIFADRTYILAEAAMGSIYIFPEHHYDPEGLLKSFTLEQLRDEEQLEALRENEQLKAFAKTFSEQKYSREPDFIQGCGAYQLKEWVSGERLTLVRKENWWGDQLKQAHPLLEAHPDEIIYRIIPDMVAATSMIKNEALDALGAIEPETFVELQKDEAVLANYQLETPPFLAYFYIAINTKQVYLEDKRVRHALAHLVDVDQLISGSMQGLAERLVGPIHPSKPYYHRGLAPIPFDPEKARILLKEAGWEDTDGDGVLDKMIDGERIALELRFSYVFSRKVGSDLALMLQNNARKVGIKIVIQALEFSKLIADSKARDFDLYYLAWSRPPTLEDLRQTWHTASDTPGGSNRTGFGNADSDAIIDSIRVTLDAPARTALYHRIQEIIYEEQPYIFLYAPRERIAIHRRFETEVSARRPGFFENTFKLRSARPTTK